MWRSSISRKRSESTLLSSKYASSSTDSLIRPPLPRRPTLPSRATLGEVLKNNPFNKSDSKDGGLHDIPSESLLPDDPVDLLNKHLHVVATMYPDVQLDVFREILSKFDGESRLQVCVEQLLRYKFEWTKGRLLNPPRDVDAQLPRIELFRRNDYKEACKRTLYTEFKALNKSAVEAVLAEVNHDYRRARPVLQEIVAKTWRATITSFFRKKKSSGAAPSFLIGPGRDNEQYLFSTGNAELDRELEALFLPVSRESQIANLERSDFEFATSLNRRQAEEAQALFECQCCYDDVPFEQITTCTTEGHVMCIQCVRRTFNEALFGQTWNTSIDATMSTLHCFTSSASEPCHGHIPRKHLHNAISAMKSGTETWTKFEQRLATDNLTKSNLELQNCPFCQYAEVVEMPDLESAAQIRWRFRVQKSTVVTTIVLALVLLEILVPALLFLSSVILLSIPFLPSKTFRQALINLSQSQQSHRFRCRAPACGKKSCTVCHKEWHDPHVCNEPLILSLRTAVEAARTAALKRVCPRCGTGFIKDSGCNKLVCVCGYAMCYLCRKNIGKVSASSNNNDNNHARQRNGAQGRAERAEEQDIITAGEGYRHFCPHFRRVPGQKCTECDKCELYKTEDEDAIVRQAGEIAEQEWRDKYEHGLIDQSRTGRGTENENRGDRGLKSAVDRRKPTLAAELRSLDTALIGIQEGSRHRRRYDGDDGWWSWMFGRYSSGRHVWNTMVDIKRGTLDLQYVVDWIVDKIVVVDADRN